MVKISYSFKALNQWTTIRTQKKDIKAKMKEISGGIIGKEPRKAGFGGDFTEVFR